jgi:hypothetical protein
MKNALKWIVPVVVVVIVGGVLIVYMNLNGIIRSTIETQTTRQLDLQTNLGGARLAILGGKLSLDDLRIASPAGFKAERILQLDGASVQVSYRQLRQQPVRIQEIVINKPRLVIEQQGGRFNLQVFSDMQPKSVPDPGAQPMRLIIDRLRVTDPVVDLYPGIPGLAQHVAIRIPTIELRNIGTDDQAQNGAAVREVVMLLVTTMAQRASESDQIPAEVRQLLSLNVEQIAQKIGGEVRKQVGRLTEDLPRRLPGQLGGLLGPATQPADGQNPGRAVEQGVRDLLGGRREPGQQ